MRHTIRILLLIAFLCLPQMFHVAVVENENPDHVRAAAAALPAVKSETEFPVPAGCFAETVTHVKHYTDRLFAFRMTRPAAFRFRSGEFVMIGLPNAEKPVFRTTSSFGPNPVVSWCRRHPGPERGGPRRPVR